jgi:hypothetical protein
LIAIESFIIVFIKSYHVCKIKKKKRKRKQFISKKTIKKKLRINWLITSGGERSVAIKKNIK